MDRAQRRRADEMLRRLEELDRLDAAYGLGTMPGSQRTLWRSRRRWWVAPLVAAALLAVVAVHPDAGLAQLRDRVGLGAEPLGAPPSVTLGLGSFAFVETQLNGTDPVAYNPCRAITYVVDPMGEPAGGRTVVDEAIAIISRATGLVFDDGGLTSRRPGESADLDSPVLIAWSDQEETPGLAGEVAGLAGSTLTEQTGVRWFMTGEIVLDRESFAPLLDIATPDSHALARAIVVHELGHLVGLDHVSDSAELMHGDNLSRTDLGPGDREGLAALGQGPCVG